MDDLGAATGVTIGGDDAIDLLLGGEHDWPEDEGDGGRETTRRCSGILGGVFGMDTCDRTPSEIRGPSFRIRIG
jgi:hypothetical protein